MNASSLRFAPVLLALLGAACSAPASLWNDAARPNVLLVTLDTTRPDHLGCHGYERATSPRLDELCAEATVYSNAYSTSSWTLPAHASLFTGTLLRSHGATYDEEGPLLLSAVLDERSSSGHRVWGLSQDAPTLAALAGEAGYATAGFVAGPWMKAVFGLGAGFDAWDDRDLEALNGRRAASVSDAALAWLAELGADSPFLVFLNYYDPHSPYDPPEEWRDAFFDGLAPPSGAPQTLEVARAFYDAEIRYMDFHLGRVLDALRASGAWDATWVVVTSDHGDLLGEHGIAGHGRFLYEEEIRIPMIVKPPKDFDGPLPDADAAIQLTDLLPLLARGLGLSEPEEAVRTRVALQAPGRRRIVAELDPGPRHRGRGRWKVLIDGPYKFVWNSRGKHRLFDLSRKGAEEINLAGDEALRARHMNAELEGLLASLPAPERGEAGAAAARTIDEGTRRALEQLGYLDPASGRQAELEDGSGSPAGGLVPKRDAEARE